MKLSTEAEALVLNRKPQLIEHFYSLEGEGQTIGRSALFIRLNQCNLSCNFCDTSFSIKGDAKQEVEDMTSKMYIEFMNSYSSEVKDNVENLSITGGEPLLNILYLDKVIDNTLKVFPKIDKIIIETNGYLLRNKEICLKLIDILGQFVPKIHITISMSPKLIGKVSHAGKETDDEVLENYKLVLQNYDRLLKRHADLQIKVVHSEELKIQNEKLINFAVSNKLLKTPIKKEKILIMPLTPNDPIGKDIDEWTESKDLAANYALQNNYRYSPRIHIDRRLS